MVWAIYLPGYRNRETDGSYYGWMNAGPRKVRDFTAPFKLPIRTFPKLGIYSSHDESIINNHLFMLKNAGVDAIIVQLHGEEELNKFEKRTLRQLFKNAMQYDMKVGIQLQSYENASYNSYYNDIKDYIDYFGRHDSLLKINDKPVVIIYEAYKIKNIYKLIEKAKETQYDCYFVSTIESIGHVGVLNEDGFDSVTTFSINGANPASNTEQWPNIHRSCRERGIGFMIAVGPGYDDKLSNDWNHYNNVGRNNGIYYDEMWKKAVQVDPDIIIINSFNNWIEGTQIEPAINRTGYEFNKDYWSNDNDSGLYMRKTSDWSKEFHDY